MSSAMIIVDNQKDTRSYGAECMPYAWKGLLQSLAEVVIVVRNDHGDLQPCYCSFLSEHCRVGREY